MKIIEFEQKSDSKEVVEDALNWVSECKGVMILAIKRDGSQILRTSTMNAMQKSFLCAFLNAWMTKWFQLENEK